MNNYTFDNLDEMDQFLKRCNYHTQCRKKGDSTQICSFKSNLFPKTGAGASAQQQNECLPTVYKPLNSIPSTTPKTKQTPPPPPQTENIRPTCTHGGILSNAYGRNYINSLQALSEEKSRKATSYLVLRAALPKHQKQMKISQEKKAIGQNFSRTQM